MSDNLKAMQECGLLPEGEIPTNPVEMFVDHQELKERLEEYTSRILASQQAAHEAEIARLKEEVSDLYESWEQEKLVVESRNQMLSAANAACAMKDEALRTLKENYEFNDRQPPKFLLRAISASPQQVSEWERKQLEPLMRRIAELEAQINK